MGKACTDYMYVQLDIGHDDAEQVAKELEGFGFQIYCYNLWTRKTVDFKPESLNGDIMCICILNQGIDKYIIDYVLEHSYKCEGPIKFFKIAMSE